MTADEVKGRRSAAAEAPTPSGPTVEPAFLTAEWRRLVMLNFTVDPAVLAPLCPRGTELDAWAGRTYISLVAFMFLNTKVRGIAVPFHRDFEEINLRFYVRAPAGGNSRRGVVFVREVVPRRAIAFVARRLYNENYLACRTRSVVDRVRDGDETTITYAWRHGGEWLSIGATVAGSAAMPAGDSEESFITEHYWGYSSQKDGSTVEYQVDHPRWSVSPASRVTMTGDFARFYGTAFADALGREPTSAFIADGSPVVVRRGTRLRSEALA